MRLCARMLTEWEFIGSLVFSVADEGIIGCVLRFGHDDDDDEESEVEDKDKDV